MARSMTSKQGHGSRACYLLGCREPACLQANARYMREWRAGHPGYAFNAGHDYRRNPTERRRAPNGSRARTEGD